MSTQPERNSQASRGPAAPSKPPASLLTVPIFRDQKDRRRHNGAPHAAERAQMGSSAVVERLTTRAPRPDGEATPAEPVEPVEPAESAEAHGTDAPGEASLPTPASGAAGPREREATDDAVPGIEAEDAAEASSDAGSDSFALDDTPLIDAGDEPPAPDTSAPDTGDPAPADARAPAPEADASPHPAPGSGPESPAPAATARRPRRFGFGAGRAPRPDSPRTAPAEKTFRDLKQYWRWLSHADFPDVDKLDASVIARNWPYTMLIRVPDDGLLDIVRVFTPNETTETGGGSATGHPFAGDRMSQISTWVLDLARQAAAERRATEARERFQLDVGSKTFAATLLPCVSAADSAAYVLLNVREA